MWRYIASGIFAFMAAFDLATGAVTGVRDASQRGASALPLEEEMMKAAEIANEKRGHVTGNTTFTGATARGGTLFYNYEIANAPKRFNTNAATERAQSMMERQVCSGPLVPALRRGATIVFRYSAEDGRDLFDASVNATICRINT